MQKLCNIDYTLKLLSSKSCVKALTVRQAKWSVKKM